MVEQHPLFAHLLTQTRQNVQLLMAHGQISETDGQEILARLSLTARHSDESLAERTQRLSMAPATPKVEARAIWEWSSEDPNDLSFDAGEIIEVITETNADWWTGRNRSGKQGLFPSNYVEKLPPRSVSPILVPEPRKSVVSVHPSGPVPEQRYASPALPHPSPLAPPQAYAVPMQETHTGAHYPPPAGPPPGAVSFPYAPPAGPPTPQPVPQAQQAPVKKSKFGGLGQVMAQSAASGAGFGAGAAIGSGIINTLF